MDTQTLEARDNVAGLPKVSIDLSVSPRSGEIERVRELIYHRIRDSSRGVVVDCTAVRGTSVDALACLSIAQHYARSENKRFALYGVTPEFRQTLTTHADRFDFPVFGERSKNEAPSGRKKRKPSYWQTPTGRRLLRILVPILIIAPLVMGLEWWYVMSSQDAAGIVVAKTFETGDAFVVKGDIGFRSGEPASLVNVFIHRRGGSAVEANECWVTRTDNDGVFDVQLPVRQTLTRLDIDVTIVSGAAARTTSHTILNGRPLNVSLRLAR